MVHLSRPCDASHGAGATCTSISVFLGWLAQTRRPELSGRRDTLRRDTPYAADAPQCKAGFSALIPIVGPDCAHRVLSGDTQTTDNERQRRTCRQSWFLPQVAEAKYTDVPRLIENDLLVATHAHNGQHGRKPKHTHARRRRIAKDSYRALCMLYCFKTQGTKYRAVCTHINTSTRLASYERKTTRKLIPILLGDKL